jgi:hypothetical protein
VAPPSPPEGIALCDPLRNFDDGCLGGRGDGAGVAPPLVAVTSELSGAPQDKQKRLASGTWAPHVAQFTTDSPPHLWAALQAA